MTPGRPAPPPLAKPLPPLDPSASSADARLAAGYGARSSDGGLVPLTVSRRAPKEDDVEIAIEFCGLCHSDVHATRGEWSAPKYPLIPGHEIVGRVSGVGSAVDDFSIGELVGVGCMVDSCRECESCLDGLEQYCEKGPVGTYGAIDSRNPGTITQGGYSSSVVVDRRYVLRVPENLDPAAVAPLLCAGITTYSPLRHFDVEEGDVVGVVGLGGLGHMAVKLAHAMGAEVTVLSQSLKKQEDGLRLGAYHYYATSDEGTFETLAGSFDLIINTVSASIDISSYLQLLTLDGALVNVGAPAEPLPVNVFALIMGRRSFAGSAIGGIRETQEMLDFCAEHNLGAEIEVIPAGKINDAYERVLASDVRYRFVIDASTLV